MSWIEWFRGFAGASPLEWIATISGFICVYLVITRNIWCFFFGLIQVSLYTWIFFSVKLYSDMLLHIAYVGFQIYGYLIWSRSLDEGGHVSVVSGTARENIFYSGIIVLTTLMLGWYMVTYTDASLPYYDAFTTCASLMAQWMLTHKKLLNWTVWILVDIVAIWVYFQKGLFPTTILYFCLLIMASIGQWQWYVNWKHSDVPLKPA